MSAAPDLGAIALNVREVILENFRQDSCIASTLVGQRVFAAHGIDSKPVTVHVTAYNRAWDSARRARVPVGQMPDNAWSVGIHGDDSLDRKNNRWNGHLALLVPRWEGKRLLMDLSADQLSRPDHDLVVPGPVCLRLSGLWTPEDPAVASVSGGNVTIEYRPQINAVGWRQSRAALEPDLHTPLVDEVLRRLAVGAAIV